MENKFPLNFAYAYGEPSCRAVFRSECEDFIVDEDLGYTPSGEGEHLFVHIKKRGENTNWVAEKLAKFFNVKNMDVGLCGMKDRHAVTSQWFSVYLPTFRESVNWLEFINQFELNIDVLSSDYHTQKLRRGGHQKNIFTIRLRELSDFDGLFPKLERIKLHGVPNYFGEQRFGREANNLTHASEWIESKQKIKSKNKRSIVMSAARSFLFNHSLSARVISGNWSTPLHGDVVVDDCPTGSLWGRGRCAASDLALEIESSALEPFLSWCEHLEHVGLNQERRILALKPIDLSWVQENNDLILNFGLLPGQYATSLLREICILDNQAA